jgi:hypothetical protein
MSKRVKRPGIAGQGLSLVYPCLLYRFQHSFTAALMVIVETFQCHHVIVQINEAYGCGVYIGIFIAQRFGDLLYIGPFHGVFLFDCDAVG